MRSGRAPRSTRRSTARPLRNPTRYKELSKKDLKSRVPRLQDFLAEGVLEDEDWEAPSGNSTSQRPISVSIREPCESTFTKEPLGRGKEPILHDQEKLDDKEKVDYKVDTDTYFTETNDAGFEGDVGESSYMLDGDPGIETMDGTALTSLPASGSLSL
ncbi:uncharacterized protein A4U43_C05F10100 [Asparagus officinalis]|uniref:Uncharacterized protein n=1 Tax=Asparagus officinalis TaxID=4686 RepID=A0A5P1EQV5_ASPOF|nr:uncharacterized protein A4U43_C05F10100 [Asparagus officinalis]